MRPRTAKSVQMSFDYSKGVSDLEKIKKLALSIKEIESAKQIIKNVLNSNIKKTIVPFYSWFLPLIGVGSAVFGMLYFKIPFNLFFLILGVSIVLIFCIIYSIKKREFSRLIRKTGKAIKKESDNFLKLIKVYKYTCFCCRGKIRLFPRIKYLIIKIRKEKEADLKKIITHKLKDPSVLIPSNPLMHPSVIYKPVDKMEKQKIEITDNGMHSSPGNLSKARFLKQEPTIGK